MAGLTPLEMLQEFQVHYDKVDVESLPKMYPEEVYLLLNDAQSYYVVEARKALEENTQLSEDLSSLVLDGTVTDSTSTPTSTTFPLNSIMVVIDSETTSYLSSLYLMKGYCTGTYKGKTGKVALKEVTHNEWEPFLSNPHTSPRPSFCPYRFTKKGIVVGKPSELTLDTLYVTFLQDPPKISPDQACVLKPQLHRPLVMKAVELAQQAIVKGTQITRGQD